MGEWKDMIEDWIQMRASLQKQVKALEAADQDDRAASDATIGRLRTCIAELNALLKAHASDSRISRAE